MLPYLITTFLGIITGVFTGLTPGIHPNLIATLSLSLYTLIPHTNTNIIIIFIFSVALTHTFLNIIPTTFLGTPDSDTAITVQPVHQYVQKGIGQNAIYLNVLGSFLTAILILSSTYFLIKIIPLTNNFIKPLIPYILIIISIIFILQEKKKKLMALICFALSGILGITVLNSTIQEPLLPLFSGLFGVPSLLFALLTKSKIPKQKNKEITINKSEIHTILLCLLLGPIFTVLPSLGPAQAALAINQIQRNTTKKHYIISTGCLNTLHAIIGLFTIYTINKSRSGTIAAINQIATITKEHLTLLIPITLIIIGIATTATIIIAKYISKKITKIDNKKLNIIPTILIIIIVIIISGTKGLLLLTIATFLGLIPLLTKVRRSNVMGCLILPTIIYYLTS